jgi:coenzyme F420-reducing hydrogenase alpha subunit
MANVITPTVANNYAIDTSLKQVAENAINGGEVDEDRLENDIGLTIRAYDPCISCATHALSFNAEEACIEIVDADGNRQWV